MTPKTLAKQAATSGRKRQLATHLVPILVYSGGLKPLQYN